MNEEKNGKEEYEEPVCVKILMKESSGALLKKSCNTWK